MKANQIIRLGCVLMGSGVMMGAFAAHGLTKLLSEYQIHLIEKGVDYQFIHGIALLVIGVCQYVFNVSMRLIASLMFIGVFCFSGSLYAIALTDWRWIWPITPFGGLCLIASWFTAIGQFSLNTHLSRQ